MADRSTLPTRKRHLREPEDDSYIRSLTPGTRVEMVWELTRQAWARGGSLAEESAGELEPSLAFDEVFGHDKGAYTGADSRRAGLLAEAGTGTVLLDDFHLMGRGAQAMLLRALDLNNYRRLGADRPVRLLARLVVGCAVDLDELVRRDVLLPDLRHRLGPLVIPLARLAERLEDIALLAHRFLAAWVAKRESGPKRFAPDAVAALELAPWPGNVRQLERAVRAACVHAQNEEVIRHEHLPPDARVTLRFDRNGDPATKRRLVRWGLWRTKGNVSAAAELIGAHRNTVRAIRDEMERSAADGRARLKA
jgi:two-component system NtrC family response regulator